MKIIRHSDGSQTHTFEVGNFVELTHDRPISGRIGEWGRVYEVSKPESSISFLSIQLAGYSRSKEAFFAAATSVPSWHVQPTDVQKAISALNELPSVCQTVGKLEVAASRCKIDSKLGKEYWGRRDKLLDLQGNLRHDVRISLSKLLDYMRQSYGDTR